MRRFRGILSATGNAIVGKIAIAALAVVRRRDPNRSIEFSARVTRRVGPWLPEHRIGRANLVAAFPEKSRDEIESLLGEVWANLGRLAAEFAHLDRLWDFSIDRPGGGRIEVAPQDIDRFVKIRDAGRPLLIFTAHCGNWELCAVAAAAHGIPSAVLYRAPNVREIDRFVREIRQAQMGTLVPTALDAPVRLANLLESGVSVGMLVDQHYSKGVDVTFFGRNCKANPLIARLARVVGCPIRGMRIIRLPDNRFRAELTDEVTPVRADDGKVDVAGTTQRITDIIESWVREYPEQWLWLHRRWR